MTAAYEAYTTVRRGGPCDVGVIELTQPAEKMWTPEGIGAGIAAASAIADLNSHSLHIRVRGTDRARCVRAVERMAQAVADGEPIPTDDFPGADGVG